MNHIPAIVAIGYNRPKSLERLLNSVENGIFPEGVKVPLVISIDKSDSVETVKVAEEFNWTHGDKVVMARSERMGLKAHVLSCGDLTKEYGSIIVLEDDLFVSPSFYQYAQKALDFTDEDERIGGVSLYNHLFDVHARMSFAAIDDGYDNWYFQFASSWGQAYTKNQWSSFKKWYEANGDKPLGGSDVPANVSGWSEKSWLKFYITYLIKTDKYFLYPRVSLTTNFGDVGSHAVKADADLQVPLMGAVKSLYCSFSKLDQSGAVYDAFFENVKLKSLENLKLGNEAAESAKETADIIVDLYGTKDVNGCVDSSAKYILSCRELPYKIVKSYGRQMRPIDANIIYEVEGDDFRLYDATTSDKIKPMNNEALTYLHEYRGISAGRMISILKYRVGAKLKK